MSEFDVTNPLASILPANNAPAYTPPGDSGVPANPMSPSMPTVGAGPSQPAVPQASQPGMPTVGMGTQPSQPAAPSRPSQGSFGQKLLQAIGGVLTGVTNAGQVALSGDPTKELARQEAVRENQKRYNAQQSKEAQERQDKLTAEQRIQQREDDESHARIAKMNVDKMVSTHLDYRMGKEFMDKQVAEESQHLKDIMGDGIHSPVQQGVSGDEINNLLQEGKLSSFEYTPFKTGTKDTGRKDAEGNPIFDYTYDVMKVPNSMPLTPKMIEQIKTVPGFKNLTEGTKMSGSQITGLLQQAKSMETSESYNRKQLSDAGIERSKEDQSASELQMVQNGDWQKAIAANNGSLVNAAASILHDPNMMDKYKGMLYSDVMYQFHGDKDSNGVKEYGVMLKDQMETQAKLREIQAKKDQELQFQGATGLVGEPFLKSLKNPREQALVREAGDGRMNATNLAALMRGKNGPEFAEALAQYAPDFQADKVNAYYDAVKKYNDDTAGSIGGQLIASGTALRGLRKLYDDTNKMSVVPGSKEYKDRQNDVATVANEVAKFNAAGRQPGEKDVADIKASLDPALPINRRESVRNQVELMSKKIQEMEDDWAQKAPSPRYQTAMPNISATSRIDSAYVLNGGKYTVPQGAQAFVDPKSNHQIFTFDGKTYYDSSNGQPLNAQGAK